MNLALSLFVPAYFRLSGFALVCAALVIFAGCTSMPATRSGHLDAEAALTYDEDGSVGRFRAPVPIDTAHIAAIEIEWRADESVTPDEQAQLKARLREALSRSMPPSSVAVQGRPVVVRAAITRVVTVSPAANVASTLLLLAPVDRGGAAVEVEAVDTETRRPLAALSFAQYAPMTELSARFKRLAPAEVSLDRAAAEFARLVGSMSVAEAVKQR